VITSTKTQWRLTLNGADRSELSTALRGTKWNDWPYQASLLDDDDPDAGYVLNFDLASMDDLVEVLSRVGHLRPVHGTCLSVNGDFGTMRVVASLCTLASGFTPVDCHIHRTAKSVQIETIKKLDEANRALSDLRDLLVQADMKGQA